MTFHMPIYSNAHTCGRALITFPLPFPTTKLNLSTIKQKCESQNGCYKKTKHAKFSEERTFLTPIYRFMG